MKTHACRYCGSVTKKILDLGVMPLVNYFPTEKEKDVVKKYPLTLQYCRVCKLGQTGVIVRPANIFPRYQYVTGTSVPLVSHLSGLADMVSKKYLSKTAAVLDIGCNDGTLLSFFAKRGHRVLGVDPAKSVRSEKAVETVPVIVDFFSKKIAKKILQDYGQFQCITLTHTLANIPNLQDFMDGITVLLAPQGRLVIEVASFEDMMQNGQIDAVYHEHYYYFSEYFLVKMLQDFGLCVERIMRDSPQGGSTIIIATAGSVKVKPTVRQVSTAMVFRIAKFAKRYRTQLRKVIRSYKGRHVVGLGAPAKAVTLLNWAGLSRGDIQYVVDSTPQKQGRYIPSVDIPVYPESYIVGKPVDAVILLAWNYRDEMLKKFRTVLSKNVCIIAPFPRLYVQKGR